MRNSELRLDRYTRTVLTALVVLLSVIAVELWVAMPSGIPNAQAQIPDTAMQRQQIAQESQKTNDLLQKILDHLRTGTVKVRMETADKRSGKG
jgi:hypothetical protein